MYIYNVPKAINKTIAGISTIAQSTRLYRHTFAPSSGPNGIILNAARKALMRAPVARISYVSPECVMKKFLLKMKKPVSDLR